MPAPTTPRLSDIPAALGLLSRLPLPPSPGARGAAAAWAWPVAGAMIGALAALPGMIALAVGLPPLLAAALCVVTQVVLTGAMHEDGLADLADGFWGGWTRQQRLAIMKDSQIGSYGTLALIGAFSLRVLALGTALEVLHPLAILIGTGALSRLPMVWLSHSMPSARPDGLSARVGRPTRRTLAIATGVTTLVAFISLGLTTLGAALALALAAGLVALVARVKIGGQTGDVLGAAQQIGEIAVLLVLAAYAT